MPTVPHLLTTLQLTHFTSSPSHRCVAVTTPSTSHQCPIHTHLSRRKSFDAALILLKHTLENNLDVRAELFWIADNVLCAGHRHLAPILAGHLRGLLLQGFGRYLEDLNGQGEGAGYINATFPVVGDEARGGVDKNHRHAVDKPMDSTVTRIRAINVDGSWYRTPEWARPYETRPGVLHWLDGIPTPEQDSGTIRVVGGGCGPAMCKVVRGCMIQ